MASLSKFLHLGFYHGTHGSKLLGRVDGGPAAVYILGMKRNNVKVPPENFSKFSDWRGLNAAPLKEGVLGIVKIFIGSI